MNVTNSVTKAITEFLRTSGWERTTLELTRTKLILIAHSGDAVVTITSTDDDDFVRQLRVLTSGYRRMQVEEDEEEADDDDDDDDAPAPQARSPGVRPRRTPEQAPQCRECDADPGEPCDCGTENEVNAHLGANWIELDPEQDRMGLCWVSNTVRLAFLARIKKLEKDRLRVSRETTKGTSRCTMSQCRDLGSGRYLHVGTGKGMWYRGRQVNVTWKETLVHYIEHHGFCPPPEFREAIDALMNHKKPVPTKRDKP